MSHGTPWILRIRAEIALAIFPNVKAWSCSRYSEIYNTGFIRDRLDQVRRSVFVESNSATIGVEGKLLVVKTIVV